MAVNLNTLLTLNADKSYYIANSTGDIKEAGLWQKFKCWTGLGDGRAKAAKLVDAVKTALLESAGMEADATLSSELAALNKNRSLSGSALREIAGRFQTANAENIASTQARQLVRLSVRESLEGLEARGATDPQRRRFAEDILNHALKPLLDHPPMVKEGERRVLDVVEFQARHERILAETEQLLADIAQSEALGRPKLDAAYTEHVKTALFNADGTRTGRGVDDLTNAAAVRYEAARGNAVEAYKKAGEDTAKVDGLIRVALEACGDDQDAAAIAVANIKDILMRGDAKLRDEAGVRKRIAGLKANLDELRECGKTDPKAFTFGFEMLMRLRGKNIPAGILTRSVQEIAQTSLDALENLSEASSPDDIHKAVRQFEEAIEQVGNKAGASSFIEGADERRQFSTFVSSMLLSRKGEGELRRLKSVFSGEAAAKLLRDYDDMGREAFPKAGIPRPVARRMKNLGSVMGLMLKQCKGEIDSLLGKEPAEIEPFAGEIDDEAWHAAVRNDVAGVAKTLLARERQDFLNEAVKGEGEAAGALRALYTALVDTKPSMPKQTVKDACKNMAAPRFARNLRAEVKNFAEGKETGFQRALMREDFEFRLANGTILPHDFETARDEIARLVTGDKTATYAALDGRTKTKTHIMMALLAQESCKAVHDSVALALDPKGEKPAFQLDAQPAGKRVFTLERYSTGTIGITFETTDAVSRLTTENGSYELGAGSTVKSQFKYEIDRAEVERLAELDFTESDGAKAPQDFRIDARVMIGFSPELNDGAAA